MGTVGGAVFGALDDDKRRQQLEHLTGSKLRLHSVGARRKRSYNLKKYHYSEDVLAVAKDPKVDVVMEAIGGVDVALEVARTAIANKKHLISANKDLLAQHGSELFAAAHKKGVAILWEAAVGGAIPVVQVLSRSVGVNRLERIEGIINGTSNYVLSAMAEKGQEFDAALAAAKKLGYAEEDPSFDVDGVDAAHKILLLSALAWGVPLEGVAGVACRSIAEVQQVDVLCAREFGYAIKPVAVAQLNGEKSVSLRVAPMLLPQQSALAMVRGAGNCVSISGDMAGNTLLVGQGAGGEPTCSAMLADLAALANGQEQSYMKVMSEQAGNAKLQTKEQLSCPHYLRCSVSDQTGVLSKITQCMSENDINVAQVWQQKSAKQKAATVVAFVTEPCEAARFESMLASLAKQPFMQAAPLHLHVDQRAD